MYKKSHVVTVCSMYTVAHRDLEAPGDINFRPQLKLAMSSGRHYIRFLKGSSFSYATNANCKEEQTQRKANSLELLALNYFVRQKGGRGGQNQFALLQPKN